jgi:hypothetical protein
MIRDFERITDTLDRLNGVSPEHRIAYLRGVALRKHIAEITAPLVTRITGCGVGDFFSSSANLVWCVSDYTNVAGFAELTSARLGLELLESSEVYKTGCEIMEPLLDLIDQDNRLIAERQAAESEALVAEREAMERARAKALAAVDKDPAVLKARAALAALQPAPAPVDPAILKAREIAAATPRLGEPLGELASDAAELAADFH